MLLRLLPIVRVHLVILLSVGCLPCSSPQNSATTTSSVTDPPAGSQRSAESTRSDIDAPAGTLWTLSLERLALMPDVARWKFNRSLPVSVPEREQKLLAELVEQGRMLNLPPSVVKPFFEAQFEIARSIQQRLIDDWTRTKHPPFDSVPDLDKELRPAITRLSTELLKTLAQLQNRQSGQMRSHPSVKINGKADADEVSATQLTASESERLHQVIADSVKALSQPDQTAQ